MRFTFERQIDPNRLQATVEFDAVDLGAAFPGGEQPPEVDDLHYKVLGPGWDPEDVPGSLSRLAQVADRAAASLASDLGLTPSAPEPKG